MKENYSIIFKSDKRKFDFDFLSSLSSYLSFRLILTENNLLKDKFINTTYQGSKFKIEFNTDLVFGNIINITTDFKTTISSTYQGFIQTIKDILIYHYNFHHSEIEVFYTKSFAELKENINERFLSRKLVCDFLEKEKLEYLNIDLHDKEINGQINYTFTEVEISNMSLELIWCSIGEKLDYDGWDKTSMEFIPISYEKFKDKLIDFSTSWNFDIKEIHNVEKKEAKTILRNYEFWNMCEYLILTEKHLKLLKLSVWTG